MSEEVMRVLKMIEEGKISAEKGKELIDSLKSDENVNVPIVLEKNNVNYDDRLLKVNVLSADGDKVNIKFPVKVIREIIKVTGKLPMDNSKMQGIDMQELLNSVVSCLDNESMGDIVDITSKDGDIVKIVIE